MSPWGACWKHDGCSCCHFDGVTSGLLWLGPSLLDVPPGTRTISHKKEWSRVSCVFPNVLEDINAGGEKRLNVDIRTQRFLQINYKPLGNQREDYFCVLVGVSPNVDRSELSCRCLPRACGTHHGHLPRTVHVRRCPIPDDSPNTVRA